jgi:hypothetical protein
MVQSNYRLITMPVIFGILLALIGCATAGSDWQQANRQDTVGAYEQFLQKHPNAEQANQARLRLKQLQSEAAWKGAESANTVAAYNAFLAQYPNSTHAVDATQRRNSLAETYNKKTAAYNAKMKTKLSAYALGKTTEAAFWNDWRNTMIGPRYSIIEFSINANSAVYKIGYSPARVLDKLTRQLLRANRNAGMTDYLNNSNYVGENRFLLPHLMNGKVYPDLRTVATLRFRNHILRRIDLQFPGVPTSP